MKPEARLLRSADGAAQATLLAAAIASELAAALTRRASASLVVSGGRTPEAMFAQLARHDIEWNRVQITLADERWVSAADPASNEAFVRSRLLRELGLQGCRRGRTWVRTTEGDDRVRQTYGAAGVNVELPIFTGGTP